MMPVGYRRRQKDFISATAGRRANKTRTYSITAHRIAPHAA
jgi:hypothetical protein